MATDKNDSVKTPRSTKPRKSRKRRKRARRGGRRGGRRGSALKQALATAEAMVTDVQLRNLGAAIVQLVADSGLSVAKKRRRRRRKGRKGVRKAKR